MPPPELVLRSATSQDAATLADLFLDARRAARPAMPAPVHSPEEVHAWFTEKLRDDPPEDPRAESAAETWVAEQEAVLGYLTLDGEWLDALYVRPELTGRGIGSVLLELAKTRRPQGFGLWVFESNHRARRFYERHGLLGLERTDGRDNEEREPDVAMVWPGADPVAFLRRRIDAVDTELGKVLARRAALTAAIQRFKPVAGPPGRDDHREAEIATRLAAQAPNLGADRIRRILHTVITESLDAARDTGRDTSRHASRHMGRDTDQDAAAGASAAAGSGRERPGSV